MNIKFPLLRFSLALVAATLILSSHRPVSAQKPGTNGAAIKTVAQTQGRKQLPKADKNKEFSKKDPAYWLEKGSLCATYGNDKGATTYFQKAIKLDHNSSVAYFNLGVSYGEIGEYEKAIAAINKALEIGDRKGLYLYGRARVYLLSGDKEKATEDFKASASLGHRDAKDYQTTRGADT